MKAAIDGKTVRVLIKAGKDGKIFGSVTNKEVSDIINKELKVDIDKKKIVMEPIKSLGISDVTVKLHKDITATVKVEVAGED